MRSVAEVRAVYSGPYLPSMCHRGSRSPRRCPKRPNALASNSEWGFRVRTPYQDARRKIGDFEYRIGRTRLMGQRISGS
jgi:hypothetical protein